MHVSGRDRHTPPRGGRLSCAAQRKATPHFFESKKFRIGIGDPTLHLRNLLIRQAVRASVLFFHFGEHACGGLLAIRWPGENAIKDCFDLIFCHSINISFDSGIPLLLRLEERGERADLGLLALEVGGEPRVEIGEGVEHLLRRNVLADVVRNLLHLTD